MRAVRPRGSRGGSGPGGGPRTRTQHGGTFRGRGAMDPLHPSMLPVLLFVPRKPEGRNAPTGQSVGWVSLPGAQ